MKKISTKILMLLGIITSLTCFTNCGATKDKDNQIQYATYSKIEGKEVVLYDYDDLSDFQEINATHAFGITKMNTDEKYVKDGSGSMHVRVDGYEEMYHHPEKIESYKQVIEMYPNWYFEQHGDFSDALCFKLDVYNVSDRDVEIGLRIKTINNDILLGPEIALRDKWNELVFEVDFEKSYYWGFESITQMQFVFDGRIQGQTPIEVYLDNFRYVKSETKATGLGYIPQKQGDILCDFEDKYFFATVHQSKVDSYPYATSLCAPKYEENNDKTYVSSGNSSLKITRYLHTYQNDIYPITAETTILSADYLRTLDLSGYDKTKYNLCIDIYNDTDEEIRIDMILRDGNDLRLYQKFKIAANSWSTLEFVMNVEHFNWETLQTIRFLMDDWYGTESSIVYVDNIRFEKIA